MYVHIMYAFMHNNNVPSEYGDIAEIIMQYERLSRTHLIVI